MLEEDKVSEIKQLEELTARDVSDQFEEQLDEATSRELLIMAMVAESIEDYA
jgi:hypothetical protein